MNIELTIPTQLNNDITEAEQQDTEIDTDAIEQLSSDFNLAREILALLPC